MMVMAKDISLARTAAENINKTLRYPHYTLSVYDLYNTIFAWIELQRKPIPIVLGLIVLVAAFNVISTLLIIVVEKTHSIGVLRTLGAKPGSIAQIFITEGLVISMIGVLVGNLFAFVVSLLQSNYDIMKLKSDVYFMSSVPIDIRWEHYAIVSAIAIAIALCSTLIPARIASRILPLKALKFG
jgi:lipoprotein-releasing system permease protein